MSHVAPQNTTQAKFPWRASIRTALVFLPVALVFLNGALLIAREELAGAGVALPEWVTLALNGVIVGTGVVIAILNRVILLPGFNDVLTRIGLGPVAK